jgi:hypothetical protein
MKKVAEYEVLTEEEAERQGTDRAWNIHYHTRRAEELRSNYMKRTKIDPATGEKITNKAAKAERMKKVKCGYCGNRGHTRRVCQNAKNDYAIYKARTRQVRQEWYDRLKTLGVGLGTMVVRRDFRGYKSDGSYGTQTLTGLITEIEWDRIDAHREGRPLVVRSNAQLRGQKSDYYTPTLPDMQLGEVTQQGSATAPDLTVLPSGRVPSMPANWLTDVKSIKEVFSTDDERPWEYKWGDSDGWQDKTREDLGLPKCAYEA